MNQILVVGIDISDLGDMGVNVDQLKLLNINVTNQQGSAINPSPVRASFPATSAAGGGGGGAAGSAGTLPDSSGKGNWWTYSGDQPPGGKLPKRWEPKQLYQTGDVVTDASGLHFYVAHSNNKSFKSGLTPIDPFPSQPRVERVLDGSVIWQEMNTIPYDSSSTDPLSSAYPWYSHTSYRKGAIVCNVHNPNNAAPGPKPLLDARRITSSRYLVASLAMPPIPRSDRVLPEAPPSEPVSCRMMEQQVDAALKALASSDAASDVAVSIGKISGYFDDETNQTLCDLQKQLLLWGAVPLKRIRANKQNEQSILPAYNLLKDTHFHYYFAIRKGVSGFPPPDPLSLDLIPRAIYLAWPYQIPPDVIPTFNVNLIYSSPAPGSIWQANTFYPAGSVVVPRENNGHYYTALTGGTSDSLSVEPPFPVNKPSPPTLTDGTLIWMDAGTSAPTIPGSPGAGNVQSASTGGQGGTSATGKPMLWFQNTRFQLGDTITNPSNGHYYTVVDSTEGFSGNAPGSAKDPFSSPPVQIPFLIDGEIQWLQTSKDNTTPLWRASSPYTVGQKMVAANGSEYVMLASSAKIGTSGSDPSVLKPSADPLSDGTISWRYAPVGDASTAKLWNARQTYAVGQTAKDSSEHVYVAISVTGGTSGAIDPTQQVGVAQPTSISDGDLLWVDIGPAVASQPAAWRANTAYKIGDTVATNSSSNNHSYRVIHITAGVSGTSQSVFNIIVQPRTVLDPSVTISDSAAPPARWENLGADEPSIDQAEPWQPNHCYASGSIVSVQATEGNNPVTQYYVTRNDGQSGEVSPFRSSDLSGNPVIDSATSSVLSWIDLGPIRPLSISPAATVPNWQAMHCYNEQSIIFIPGIGNGRYYKSANAGSSGKTSPFLSRTPPFSVTWEDSGTTPPSSVSNGQPADQNVSLINLTLPQSHALSYFNISSGVVVNLKRPPVFGFVPASGYSGTLPPGYTAANPVSSTTGLSPDPNTGCTVNTSALQAYACPEQVSTGPHSVDPVLVLTGYIPPVDAERPMNLKHEAWRDLLPAPGIAISLSNPTTNFYLGLSNEALIRDLQVFYGVAFHNTGLRLAPGGTQPLWGGSGTAPAPATISGFQKGAFVGVTFNLSGFIQSLFGGGGGGAK